MEWRRSERERERERGAAAHFANPFSHKVGEPATPATPATREADDVDGVKAADFCRVRGARPTPCTTVCCKIIGQEVFWSGARSTS